ncbi:MAG: 30S ribosomal protein S4 [Bacteroidia bacterium]|nr:30S ribosomal protein S4 [Bacteroidia bacterium]
MRFTGSDYKRSRHLGFSTLETGEELRKRSYGPGQHGNSRKRKPSEYGKQLIEKQKLRHTYGVNERQFRRLFTIASKSKEVTGVAFFRILESRLDNLVFRMGFSRTRRGAKQLVNHGHIVVNGKKVDISSYLCSVNDVIAIRESSKDLKVVKEALESKPASIGYVKVDAAKLEGVYVRYPERNELPMDINEAQVIEYYNRLL